MHPDQPTPTGANANAESPQQILARRLAELNADKPAATHATADAAPADITEQPAQGSTPLPANQPAGAGTAEPSAAATEAAEATHAAADQPNTPPAAAEQLPTSVPVPPAPTAFTPPAEMPEPTNAPTPQDAPMQPAPEAPAAEAPHVTPVVDVPAGETVAEALEATPGVGSLPTSSDSPASPGTTTMAHQPAAPALSDAPAAAATPAQPAAPAVDFDSLDLAAQAAHLRGLLGQAGAGKKRQSISDLYRRYETGLKADRASQRQQFVDAGGTAEEFTSTDPAGHQELQQTYQEFRASKVRDAKAEDEQRGKNLTRKQELLTQLRQLVESAETEDSSARIKSLQSDWKNTGPVPQTDSQELWNSYHALLDIYYNNRGLFFEMKELDRRRNQEAKEVLIVRAEALAEQTNINKATQELRQLHEEWKHIGPVPNEQREPLWQRFLQASELVHGRRQEASSARNAEETANLERKTALLAQIMPFGEFETERVNEWRGKTDELQQLKQQWDAAGLVPRKQAEQVNKQFWSAYKGFFQKKNQFFKALDEEKSTNLKRKLEMCEQAEAALQSPDWEASRQTVIQLQKEWKLVGRVPEKQSDKVWKRFRTACDAFFDRKKEEGRQREQQVQQLSEDQTNHLAAVAEAVAGLSAEQPGTLEGFREQIAGWRAFDGATRPQAEERFQKLMAQYLTQVPDLAYQDRTDLLFSLQVERLKASPDSQQLLYKKEQALRREISELENDISTLQTNLEFFARSKNAAQLREEYQGRVDEAQVRIENLKRQLKAVRS
ncbi:DUF349 domain-containing protein [Hymenobacter actinosclerus]|uniref:DUF349 domain-containing protein n=1 Tax=Hymenobacter actinosclerus TaxID=82805 RepID=A0A1I0E0F7_9BACT|nr:DUF349 domain-containing protein [Hymenobacter actinosclerus]SET38200.1 protein of unknown function [Hymenobacter actinosclerus]